MAKNDKAAEETTTGTEGENAAALPADGNKNGNQKKRIIILASIAVFIIVAGAAGAYFSGLLGGSHEAPEEELNEAKAANEQPVYYTLPEFLVNLNTSGAKQTSFLKATIVLELSNAESVKQVEANLPRVLDAFNTYLREMRTSDLSGSAGIHRLREELLLRANKAIMPIKANDVLFKEIIIQ